MNYCIPVLVLGVVLYSYFKKVDIYQTFLDGAKEGVNTVFDIIPAVVAGVKEIYLTSPKITPEVLEKILN